MSLWIDIYQTHFLNILIIRFFKKTQKPNQNKTTPLLNSVQWKQNVYCMVLVLVKVFKKMNSL